MHQQPADAPFAPNKRSMSAQRAGVTGSKRRRGARSLARTESFVVAVIFLPAHEPPPAVPGAFAASQLATRSTRAAVSKNASGSTGNARRNTSP